MRGPKRAMWVAAVAVIVVVAGLGLSAVAAQDEEPPGTPPGTPEVPQEILDRLQERLDSGQAGPLFGVIHGDLSLTRFDGSTVELVYDRGVIVERTGGTLTVARLDGEQVSIAVDDRTTVREGLRPGSVDDLAVGDRAMFLSERLDDGSLHAVGIRCIEHRPFGPPGDRGGDGAADAAALSSI